MKNLLRSILRTWLPTKRPDPAPDPQRPALHALDSKLERHVSRTDGFYVEAGANDGVNQSNTYYFEHSRGWRGVLIEADPRLCEHCRRARPNSITIHAALVSRDYPRPTIALHQAGLMSIVDGAMSNEAIATHLERARHFEQPVTGRMIEVPARTLERILAEAGAPAEFDLLSLDVEGFEPAVLDGLNLAVWRPRFICIEVRDRVAIMSRLLPHYEAIECLHHERDYEDILFRRRPS